MHYRVDLWPKISMWHSDKNLQVEETLFCYLLFRRKPRSVTRPVESYPNQSTSPTINCNRPRQRADQNSPVWDAVQAGRVFLERDAVQAYRFPKLAKAILSILGRHPPVGSNQNTNNNKKMIEKQNVTPLEFDFHILFLLTTIRTTTPQQFLDVIVTSIIHFKYGRTMLYPCLALSGSLWETYIYARRCSTLRVIF